MRRLLLVGACALGTACADGADVGVRAWPACDALAASIGPLVQDHEGPFTEMSVGEPGVADGMACRWGRPRAADADTLRAALGDGGDIRVRVQVASFRTPRRLRHDAPRAAAIGGFVQTADGVYDPAAEVEAFAPRVVAGGVSVSVDQLPFLASDVPGRRLTVDDAVTAAVDIHRALRAAHE